MSCDHEYQSYDSESLDRTSIIIFYECLKCGALMEDVQDEPLRTDDLDQ